MGRHREHQTALLGLLPRMEAYVGKRATSFRYRPRGGKPIPLGTDRIEAIRKVLDLLGKGPDTGSLRWVWESYRKHRRFLKLAPATRLDYEQCWQQIDPILGGMPIARIDAPMVAKYVSIERADAPSRANHEKALLSNLFAHGITLGACTSNPAKMVRPNEEEPRPQAPAQLVLARFLKWVNEQTPQRRIIGLAAQYASLTGSRKVEFLPLEWAQVDWAAGVVYTPRAKQRGKKRHMVTEAVAMTPRLRTCLLELQACRPDEKKVAAVFPQRSGAVYTDRGFKTLWQRIVLAAIEAKIITKDDRFTFHDLRAYFVTHHKRLTGKLPDLHKNPATTAGVYDRTEVVERSAI